MARSKDSLVQITCHVQPETRRQLNIIAAATECPQQDLVRKILEEFVATRDQEESAK